LALATRLAEQLIERHPERAALVLERAAVAESARLVERSSALQAAVLIQGVSPASLLVQLETGAAARALDSMALDIAARLLRRVPAEAQGRLIERMAARRARAVRALLRFPENSAGAWMDPDALALPEDLTARESLRRVREGAAHAGYYLYVVDRQQRLIGALNLRELLLARPRARLLEVMRRDPLAIPASADGMALIRHPGWSRVHCLPVVDERGGYLGAVRYRTLRALEASLLAARARDVDAGRALGELLAAGAAGLLDAMAGAAPSGVSSDV
jgi:magnesium transporter